MPLKMAGILEKMAMKRFFICMMALALCVLLGCQKEQSAQESSVLPETQAELVQFWNDHVVLGGNLPDFCAAVRDNTEERFRCGVLLLDQAQERFQAYLWEERMHLPEEAFGASASWLLSDTPRGNLRLEGPQIVLLYCPEEDVVRIPRSVTSVEKLHSQVEIRFSQASTPPDFDPLGSEAAAFSVYLEKHPDIWQDDGKTVLDDAAWIVRRNADGNAMLCFLRVNPFCGVSQSTLLCQDDGTVVPGSVTALDEGWFLSENCADYFEMRLKAVGCADETARLFQAWLTESEHAEFAAKAVDGCWLMEEIEPRRLRLRILQPGKQSDPQNVPEEAGILVEQLWSLNDIVYHGVTGALPEAARTITSANAYRTVNGFSLACPAMEVPLDQWNGFYQLTPNSETCADCDSYTNGVLTICCAREAYTGIIQHIHILTDDANYQGVTLGDSVEQFWAVFQDTEAGPWNRYPERQTCVGSGFSVEYKEENGILTALWLYCYV